MPERPETAIEDLQKFKKHIILFERYGSRPGFSIIPLAGQCRNGTQNAEQALHHSDRYCLQDCLITLSMTIFEQIP